MSRITRTVWAVALLVLAWPTAAVAATGEEVGKNFEDMMGSIAKSVYAGLVAIVALVFLFNRRFAELAVFVIAAIVVGGFVLAPNDVMNTVRDIWHGLTS